MRRTTHRNQVPTGLLWECTLAKWTLEATAGGRNRFLPALVGLVTAGLVLVAAGAAGILNLIPCSAGIAVAGGSVATGLLAAAVALVFGQGGMRLFFSGRLKVTGNQRLARKMKDEFDEQK